MRRSFRLWLLSLFLRLVIKTALSLTKSPQVMRARFERADAYWNSAIGMSTTMICAKRFFSPIGPARRGW